MDTLWIHYGYTMDALWTHYGHTPNKSAINVATIVFDLYSDWYFKKQK